jgi:hypothetical protein
MSATTEAIPGEKRQLFIAIPRSAAARLTRLLAVAVLAAALTTVLAVPWSGLRGLGVAALLALPVCVILSFGLAALESVLLGRLSTWSPQLRRWSFVGVVWSLVFSLGAGISNVVLIDQALKRRMLMGYAVSALIASAAAMVCRWQLGGGRLGRWLAVQAPRTLGVLIALPMTIVFALFDALFLTHGYWTFHVGLLALTLVGACVFFNLWLQDGRGQRLWVGLALAVALATGLGLALAGSWRPAFDAMLAHPTSHQ